MSNPAGQLRSIANAALVALIVTALATSASAQVPGEVTGVTWCSGAKTCLQWPAVGLATGYRIARGAPTDLPNLLNASIDSCNGPAPVTTSSGFYLDESPSLGSFYWYLVLASNSCAEGTPGTATPGPRMLNASGLCSPQCADAAVDGFETDTDCGGPLCPACPSGDNCGVDSDCVSRKCALSICQFPTCSDGTQNSTETGVDCGGGSCAPCPLGQSCCFGSDCASAFCVGGTCTAPPCQNGVQDGTETGIDCGGGVCPTCPNGQGCAGDSDCTSGNCVTAVCQPLSPNGASCTLNSNCLSGNCVDGVCCISACGGTCMACNLPGNIGNCTNIPAGQDPANECAGASNCNGAGACALLNGSTCVTNSQCQSGNCVDGVCCNSTCGGACLACNVPGNVGTCTNVPAGQDPANECAGPANCNGAGACALLNGSTCATNPQCQSGNCVDGVCCNSTCNTVCKACNIAGSLGTCTNIPPGQDPANECAGAATCNGAGACGP